MDLLISFFRDTLSGWLYFVNFIINAFLILVFVGIMGDKRKAEIQRALRAKREYELVTGISAKKAAMEGKQIISVLEESSPPEKETPKVAEKLELNDESSVVKSEAAPAEETTVATPQVAEKLELNDEPIEETKME